MELSYTQKMKINCTPIKGKDLKPGDLFSTVGSIYWDNIKENKSIGEKVYIRTEIPYENASDFDITVYKLEIETTKVEPSDLIPLLEADIQTLKQVQEEGDYLEVETFLSDIQSTFYLLLKALKGEARV